MVQNRTPQSKSLQSHDVAEQSNHMRIVFLQQVLEGKQSILYLGSPEEVDIPAAGPYLTLLTTIIMRLA